MSHKLHVLSVQGFEAEHASKHVAALAVDEIATTSAASTPITRVDLSAIIFLARVAYRVGLRVCSKYSFMLSGVTMRLIAKHAHAAFAVGKPPITLLERVGFSLLRSTR